MAVCSADLKTVTETFYGCMDEKAINCTASSNCVEKYPHQTKECTKICGRSTW